MSDISASFGANTFVSGPGGPQGGMSGGGAALPNGAGAPGANISMTYAVVVPLAVAGAGLAVLWKLFRREGVGLPPLRIDAANVVNIYLSWMVLNVPLKLLAYQYHGHKLAQAYLLVA
jgi:hypothetical protein